MPARNTSEQPNIQTSRASGRWALLVDGSALFFGQRAVSPDKNLNYIELANLFRSSARSSLAPRPALFFTAADEGNEKQAKFHRLIEDLGWIVRSYPPHDAVIANPLLSDSTVRTIRFDTMIAWSLGRLAGQPEIEQIFVVSDSWPLAGPIQQCVRAHKTAVTLAFFGQVVDTRWHRILRDADENLSFLDLDLNSGRLFDRARPTRRREDEILPDVP